MSIGCYKIFKKKASENKSKWKTNISEDWIESVWQMTAILLKNLNFILYSQDFQAHSWVLEDRKHRKASNGTHSIVTRIKPILSQEFQG